MTFREWGGVWGTPIVFWPGLNPSAPWQLNEAGPAWAERYPFRVLALSPPGSETPPLAADEYRPSALARRLVGLLDRLELERVAYVGFSWGASIGCHLAAAAPERLSALVLLDAGYTDFQDAVATRTVAQEWARRALERFQARVPRAEVRTLDSGHDLLADAPEETIALVGEWLNAVTMARA